MLILKTMRKHGLILALFAAGCTGLTAVVHQLTARQIALQIQSQQNALFAQVLSGVSYNNQPATRCFITEDAQLGPGKHRIYLAYQVAKPVAVIAQATAPDGYSGAIQLLVGANFSGTIFGVRVTGHHETPGLGDKIDLRISDWITHFAGRHIQRTNDPGWAVKKDGGQFDQFTGATITPRAVVNAVKRAGLYAETLPSQLNQLTPCGAQP